MNHLVSFGEDWTPLPTTERHLMPQSSTTSTLSSLDTPTRLNFLSTRPPLGGPHVDPVRLEPTSDGFPEDR